MFSFFLALIGLAVLTEHLRATKSHMVEVIIIPLSNNTLATMISIVKILVRRTILSLTKIFVTNIQT